MTGLDLGSRGALFGMPVRPGFDMHPFDPSYRTNYDPGYPMAEEERGGFEALRLLFYVLQYRWLILAMTALAIVSGALFTFMQTPIYKATVRLEVLVPSAKIFKDLEVTSETGDLRAFMTAREKIQSRAVAERVVYELDLSENADFLFPEPDIALSNLFERAFGLSRLRSLDEYAPDERERMAIRRIRENLDADLINNTSLLSVTFRDQDPQTARRVANQVAQSFIDQKIDKTSKTSDLARRFVQEQVRQVKSKLQDSEKDLVAYARREGLTLDDKSSSLILTSIRDINAALSEAVRERLDKKRAVAQIDAGRGASISQVLESEGIQNLREHLGELRADYRQKLRTFKPGYPEMQQLAAQIGEMENQIDQAVEVVTDSIRLEYDDAKAKVTALRSKMADLERQQSDFQQRNIQYTILKRDVDSYRSQYDSLIEKLNEAWVGSELKTRSAEIVDRAATPRAPYSPRIAVNLAAFLVFAMGASAGTIYMREMLNNTFSGPEQIETELRLPVLGIIPRARENDVEEAIRDPRSGLSEAYRSLRTALQFSGTEGSPKSLLVTSSEPSEGKSTSAMKLAEDFAILGSKVLVIDADLRKPNLHRLFGVGNTIGLSNLLTNTASPEDFRNVIKPTRYENVRLLTSGTFPPNPADLLSWPKMAQLMRIVGKRFDLVIIDAPPVIGLSDAPILSRLTEGTLLVVTADQVARKGAAAALKRLRAAGANVLGVSLTKFEVKKFDYHYAHGYVNADYYGHGSERGQIAEATRKDRSDAGRKSIAGWLRDFTAVGASDRA